MPLDRDISNAPRVKACASRVELYWKRCFAPLLIPFPPSKVHLRIYKQERVVEAWVATHPDSTYRLATSWSFTSFSGKLGPKNQVGDRQIPEGFYKIAVLNPYSKFHLSLGLNYPNAFDCKRSKAKDLGRDIFIHGYDVTIGCIPIGNEAIEELFWLAATVKSKCNEIPVHIFPCRMTKSNLHQLNTIAYNDSTLLEFWRGLAPYDQGFSVFHQVTEPAVSK